MVSIQSFGLGEKAPTNIQVDVLGGKGAFLCDMALWDLPVPPGLVIPVDQCMAFLKGTNQTKVASDAVSGALKQMAKIEKALGRPTLWSVRSGAPVSMPGMMETILNVGITNESRPGLEKHYGKPLIKDCYKRLRTMFKDVVGKDLQDDWDLEFQLLYAVISVWRSWNSPRAKHYRNIHGIPHDMGTAVVIQAMVFGNAPGRSCSGVVFTRDPSTGEDVLAGEFLPNAQGEDVVDGKHNPLPIEDLWRKWPGTQVNKELLHLCETLEGIYCDVQDVEFTVEREKVWLLQTRRAKRTARAAFKIAADYLEDDEQAGLDIAERITIKQWQEAHSPAVDPSVTKTPTVTGSPASSGVGVGAVATTSEQALTYMASGEPFVLVRPDTNPDDIEYMAKAKAIVTAVGGMTCHAAVVARSMGIPCVVGVGDDMDILNSGETITVCGTTGRIWGGKVPVVDGTCPDAQTVARAIAKDRNVTLISDFVFEHMVVSVNEVVSRAKDPVAALNKIGADYRKLTGRLPTYFVSSVSAPDSHDETSLMFMLDMKAPKMDDLDTILSKVSEQGYLIGTEQGFGNLAKVTEIAGLRDLKTATGNAVFVRDAVIESVFGDRETLDELAGLWKKDVILEPIYPQELFK